MSVRVPAWLVLGLLLAATLSALPARSASRRAHYFQPGTDAPPAPKRIVSLAPVLTETLFALGVGDRVVGVTRYCDKPVAATELPRVGGFVDPQLERILGLRPDLVVAMPSFGQRTVLARLRDRGVPVFVAFGDTLTETRDLISGLGRAVHARPAAQATLKRLDEGLAAIAGRSLSASRKSPRVLILFQLQPFVVAGPGTFPDEALVLAGARPAVPRDAPAWPAWSLEAVLAAKPDVIVTADGQASAQRLRELLGDLPAARRIRVLGPPRVILMRPGPSLHEDIAVLARLIAPAAPPAPAPPP